MIKCKRWWYGEAGGQLVTLLKLACKLVVFVLTSENWLSNTVANLKNSSCSNTALPFKIVDSLQTPKSKIIRAKKVTYRLV